MPRNPLPTAIVLMKGADRKNPQRYRGRRAEPVPAAGLRRIPVGIDAQRRAIWKELEGQIATGVLTHQDSAAFELLVDLFTLVRVDPYGVSATKLMVLVNLLGRFGMTPVDRTRLKVTDGSDVKSNPFSEFSAHSA